MYSVILLVLITSYHVASYRAICFGAAHPQQMGATMHK